MIKCLQPYRVAALQSMNPSFANGIFTKGLSSKISGEDRKIKEN